MQKQEYIIILKNRETLETIDMLYTYANDINHAQEIAKCLLLKYDDVNIDVSIVNCYKIDKEEKRGTIYETRISNNFKKP